MAPEPAMGEGVPTGGPEGSARDGRVVSVNVGSPRTVWWRGRAVTSAIWKSPVDGRVAVRGVNIAGDDQADRSVHGGPTKAVYAYAAEDYARFGRLLGRDLSPGTFGDNLTVAGLDPGDALIGERWEVGTALLQVTEPRIPCLKLAMRMADPAFVKRFGDAGMPGTYLAIVREGDVAAGDRVRVVDRPAHGVTVSTVSRAYLHDRALAAAILAAPELPLGWRRWAEETVASRRAG